MDKAKKPDAILRLEKHIGRKITNFNTYEGLNSALRGFMMAQDGTITGLNLYRCEIYDLSFITPLTDLEELYLTENEITDLSPLTRLTKLKVLILNGNQISYISPLSKLPHLNVLILSDNNIADLSPIAKLTELKSLHLSFNRITDISPLTSLTQLEKLYLDNNKIIDISTLAQLSHLKSLWLNRNYIYDISPLIPLLLKGNLEYLDLSDNRITQIPQKILKFPIPLKWENDYMPGISLEDNPLKSPPIEIVKQGHDAVVSYFRQLQGAKVPLHQCKLLIVGAGEVGKTTLMKKLKDPSYTVKPGTEETTHGIDIIPWELPCCFENGTKETIKISLWDFGGQEIYHATHQFFLTKRSLYILVWEARKEDFQSFDYWLNIVKLLSNESPVIVVMNKSDIRIIPIDEATFKQKFPNIIGFLKISCLTNTGLTELTQLIQKTLEEMPHLRDLLPASWLKIRDELKALRKNHIPSPQFFEICEKHNVNREDANVVADYLHDLGIILYFRHDPLLAGTVILNPEWATQALYILCDTNDIILNNGSFQFQDLQHFWDTQLYPVDKHPQIIRLMEKFELCFNFLDTPRYFVPELLPGETVEFDRAHYQEPHAIHFQYRYKFMPPGILSRFISRLYYLIHQDRFWKFGVELAFDDTTAIVLNEYINSRIQIHVTGSNKKELLSIIRSHFNHIHQTLKMSTPNHYDEMIPCNCETCTHLTQPQEPNYYSYTDLIKYRQNDIRTIPCRNSFKQINIDLLLNGFEPTAPNHDILKTLLEASKHLMGLSKSMKPDEDSRTGLLCLLMNEKGFTVKDQTRWGQTESGKSPGRLDAMIKSPLGHEAVLEAFKLTNLDSKVISEHCLKIFNYDPVGLKNNFIVVYCDCNEKTFTTLWDKYKNLVWALQFPYEMKSLTETTSSYAGIKIAQAIHDRHNTDVGVYHLFLHMATK